MYPWEKAIFAGEIEFTFYNDFDEVSFPPLEPEPPRTDLLLYEQESPRISMLAYEQYANLPYNILGRLASEFENASVYLANPNGLFFGENAALDVKGSPASHFMKHGRVALSGGRRFGAAWDQFVRVNFATSRPILTEIVDRMAKALGR